MQLYAVVFFNVGESSIIFLVSNACLSLRDNNRNTLSRKRWVRALSYETFAILIYFGRGEDIMARGTARERKKISKASPNSSINNKQEVRAAGRSVARRPRTGGDNSGSF